MTKPLYVGKQCHIENPFNRAITLCRLSAYPEICTTLDYDTFRTDRSEDYYITVEESFEEELWPEDERCSLCWDDEEKRTLLLLATVGEEQ
jgi:hypothetical protein